ncbi:long-chain fatty acid--CoA ligase, partial [bacterium]|nr:long-chain fatty acid--CoA ligase [bacterium]
MFDAYLHPWQLRSEVVDEDGWFSTGDIAEVDAQGLFHLKGRAISCINVGGLKCFPEEIEAILNSHPAIRASRVFSRPNPITGFSPAAEIVPADPSNPPTIATIIKHCREHLAAYKIPLSIQTVTAIQTTPSGKIPRNTDIATVPLNTTPSC